MKLDWEDQKQSLHEFRRKARQWRNWYWAWGEYGATWNYDGGYWLWGMGFVTLVVFNSPMRGRVWHLMANID